MERQYRGSGMSELEFRTPAGCKLRFVIIAASPPHRMFKKPLGTLKTSSALRSSDRRKLRNRISQTYKLSPEESDALVPDPILSAKFLTHLDEPGIVYLAPETGDPVWFTIGKGSDELIPTVYTLFKRRNLLPCLSTPSAVIPVLIGGADLMIPGVIQHPPTLRRNQLVAITQYEHPGDKLCAPLAVGRMAIDVRDDGSGRALRDRDNEEGEGRKGKAVLVLHTWKDSLWNLGESKAMEPPPPEEAPIVTEVNGEQKPSEESATSVPNDGGLSSEGGPAGVVGDALADPESKAYTPEEVSSLLRKSLIQAMCTTLASLPSSAFPMHSTMLYTTHIMPSRPASLLSSIDSPAPTNVGIKHSTFKSLTAFLKAAEKEGLLALKSATKGTADILVLSVNKEHPDVQRHVKYGTLRDVEERKGKKEDREERERAKVKEVGVKEMWNPWQESMPFFKEAGVNTNTPLTIPELKAFLTTYITSKNLINVNDQQYINVGQDLLLSSLISSGASFGAQAKSKSKAKEAPARTSQPTLTEFMKREEIVEKLLKKMQPWHELTRFVEGREPDVVLKKGELKPIQVVIKVRQGRKASTLITNFESWFIEPDALAEELKKMCASSTSVSPAVGGKGMEVLVQGKQVKAVLEVLSARGVPRKWIDADGEKK